MTPQATTRHSLSTEQLSSWQSVLAPLAVAAALVLFANVSATAQVTDTLRENPKIHLLKHIWRVNGEEEQDAVGVGMGSVGDINGDGVTDIAYHTGRSPGRSFQWNVHLGASPAPEIDSVWSVSEVLRPTVKYPIVAEFIPGKMVVGFPKSWQIDIGGNSPLLLPGLFFYDTANGSLLDTTSHAWEPHFQNESQVGYFVTQFLAEDLDREPGDEFVALSHGRRDYDIDDFGYSGEIKPEIWIYTGGVGFGLESPAVIIPIADSLPETSSRSFHALISDFDGDEYPDLISIGAYAQGTLMHIWFGDESSPWDWTSTPDRTIDVSSVGLRSEVTHGDFDGDGLLDFAGSILRNERFITNIFLSGSGKSIRDRSFSEADVDRAIFTDVFQTVPGPAPFLNDSTRRYAMLALKGPSRFERDSDMLYFLSGGLYGPNATADAFWAPSRDGVASGPVLWNTIAVPDCNGDGFDDLMVGDPKWYYTLFSYGISLVLAGTDSIPNDDPTVSVRSGGSGSAPEKLVIQPNPVRSQMTIEIPPAFQREGGTLQMMNAVGELVEEREVARGTARVSLDLPDLPAGVYFVQLSQPRGNQRLEGFIIKEDAAE